MACELGISSADGFSFWRLLLGGSVSGDATRLGRSRRFDCVFPCCWALACVWAGRSAGCGGVVGESGAFFNFPRLVVVLVGVGGLSILLRAIGISAGVAVKPSRVKFVVPP